MKLDLSTTFLNGADDVTAALAPKARSVRWRRQALVAAIVLFVVGYLALVASSLREQFRPEISSLPDGWFRVVNRDLRFQFDLPRSPTKRVNGSVVEYYNSIGENFAIGIRSYSVGRPLLSKSSTKVLQEIAQSNASSGKVTILGMGLPGSTTHWLESKSNLGGAEQTVRTRWMIHNTQLLELSLSGPEAEVMSAAATRILNSAEWLNR